MAEQFLQYGPYLLAGYLAFIMGILSPGPNVVAIVGTSMGTSRKAGVMMACGISTGSFFWATLAVLGFTVVLTTSAWLGTFFRILGGLYLGWIGYNYFRSAMRGNKLLVSERVVDVNSVKLFLHGLAVQLTNPKAALYWVSVMSLVLQPNAPAWVGVAMIVGVVVLSFVGHIAWAMLFSTKKVVALYQAFKTYLDAALGTFFAAMGAGLVLSVFRSESKI